MPKPFSYQIEEWLKKPEPQTLDSLIQAFGEKSFAIMVLLLMFLPALPIPTAGFSHVFELIVMLLGVELMLGRRTVWLPKRWRNRPLGKTMQKKTLPLMVRRIRWLERYSRPRLGAFINHPFFLRFVGGLFFVLALAAFVVIPGVGLDTLPAMGAVLIALSLILGDVVLFTIGCIVGAVGLGLVIAAGSLTIHFFERVIHFIITPHSN